MDIFQALKDFSTRKKCIQYLEKVRWHNKPVCPYCGTLKPKPTPVPREQRYHCNSCNTSFSVTVDTIFHNTNLPLQKWFLALSLILNAKKGISSRQLARHLKVQRNTAWRVSMKIRQAMQSTEQNQLLTGIIEMDETYIGGKPRAKNDRTPKDRDKWSGKIPIVGMVERNGNVKAAPMQRITTENLMTLVRNNVNIEKSTLITDQEHHYWQMSKLLPHHDINHSVCFVDGWIHTNSIESFWALLKRGIIGQFHKVSAKHLHKYINEFAYRFNHRDNGDVFSLTMKRAVG